jgi:Flp pilus assembly protein TadG
MARNPVQLFGRGKRANAGSAAIEFAMIAPLFFLMLFATLETGLAYFANMTLQNGVQETARLIRTGQAQKQNMTQSQFRQRICDEIKVLLSCDGEKLYIDIRSFGSFSNPTYPPPLDNQQNMSNGLDAFDMGDSSANGGQAIVLFRAYYKWQLYTPMFGKYFANMSGNQRLLSASMAFRNEPY